LPGTRVVQRPRTRGPFHGIRFGQSRHT
jgi:hypothetical protein